MALDPPSDIVLDVARAADPERAAAVARRLASLGASSNAAAPGFDFAAALDETRSPAAVASPRVPVAPDLRARLAELDGDSGDKAAKAEVKFEAVMLNSFISEMLPKDAPDAFGKGVAGQMWRSLLSEKIANQIAGSGALGLGQHLFATHPISATQSLSHAARADQASRAATAQSSVNALSVANGADVKDGSVLFARVGSL